ncbi:hypothetical protein HK097_006586, partial [Rhizophlyctis rosea]
SEEPPPRRSSRRKSRRKSILEANPSLLDSVEDLAPTPVLHKEVVTKGGIVVETEDPSHLFWVPAHLHPELHPTDFRKWLAKHDEGEADAGVGTTVLAETGVGGGGGGEGLLSESGVDLSLDVGVVVGREGKPLRRTKSFIERHVSITPENLEEFVGGENGGPGRGRSVSLSVASSNGSALDAEEGKAEGKTSKGLGPLKRSRNIRPRKSTLERQLEQEGKAESGGEETRDDSSVKSGKEGKKKLGLAPRSKKGKKVKATVLGLPNGEKSEAGEMPSSVPGTFPDGDVCLDTGVTVTGPYCPYPHPDAPIDDGTVSTDDEAAGSGGEDAGRGSGEEKVRSSSESTRSHKEKESKKWGWFSSLMPKPKKSSQNLSPSSSSSPSDSTSTSST